MQPMQRSDQRQYQRRSRVNPKVVRYRAPLGAMLGRMRIAHGGMPRIGKVCIRLEEWKGLPKSNLVSAGSAESSAVKRIPPQWSIAWWLAARRRT